LRGFLFLGRRHNLSRTGPLPKIFAFHELAAISPGEEDALLDALDEAAGAQLIRASSGGDSYAFTMESNRVANRPRKPLSKR